MQPDNKPEQQQSGEVEELLWRSLSRDLERGQLPVEIDFLLLGRTAKYDVVHEGLALFNPEGQTGMFLQPGSGLYAQLSVPVRFRDNDPVDVVLEGGFVLRF